MKEILSFVRLARIPIMHRFDRIIGILVGTLLLGSPLTAADPDLVAADEQILQAARVPTDGAGLLDYFRKRTLADVDRGRLEALIRKLGDDNFEDREKAS